MFHFEKNFGLFVGKLTDNKFHKHYALQISVSSSSTMKLSIKGESEILGNAFLVSSNVKHQLISNVSQLTILINPLSSIGHQLYLKFGQSNFSILDEALSTKLIRQVKKLERKEFKFGHLPDLIAQILSEYKCSCEAENHLKEDRIVRAIKYMDANFEKILSLEEVSAQCFLSPSRFLHLFKEKTNLNFRRYQLWNKVVKSLPYLLKNSITETAYTFGFSDSSHYSRTFSETFGVTPKFFLLKE